MQQFIMSTSQLLFILPLRFYSEADYLILSKSKVRNSIYTGILYTNSPRFQIGTVIDLTAVVFKKLSLYQRVYRRCIYCSYSPAKKIITAKNPFTSDRHVIVITRVVSPFEKMVWCN